MFTGIVEEIGHIKRISKKGQAMELTIEARLILEDAKLGDSIAINGVCLTITNMGAYDFSADVMPETFRKTTLHLLEHGSEVNLERAMLANGRFGGHIVQGHVDGVGIVRKRVNEENAVVFTIEPKDSDLLRYMIDHGSITIDGISLTIVKVSEATFTVSIIPHTLSETVLKVRQAGDLVNLECDVLGKYVEKLMLSRLEPNQPNQSKHQNTKSGTLTAAFLADNGFI